MKQRLIFFGLYTLFWLLVFIICKILFLFFFYNQSAGFPLTDWFLIFSHGFKLDLSAAGYVLLLPVMITTLGSFFKGRWFTYFINVYTILILLIASFVLVIDLELYRHWGFRIDTTPLLYIDQPKEAFTSVSILIIFRQIILAILIFSTTIFIYFKYIARQTIHLKPGKWLQLFVFLFLTGFLIIPIRGGLGIAPINTGSAYFHEKAFPNHAALNVFWNLGYSLANFQPKENPYRYLEKREAEILYDGLFDHKDRTDQVLRQEMPNVIILILESFNSKIIEVLGGREGITPQFNQLTREGILFKNFYATGDRTDKGLVGILSGYPAQPTYSIIKFPKKTAGLPNVVREIKKLGYTTSFYYGGSIDFANMRSYLVTSGFDKIISKVDFAPSTYNSKWGVHDHILLDRFAQDIFGAESPFFSVLMTLSSHEPFEVPMETVITGEDEESQFLNSCYYTDKSVGDFIHKAQKEEWWDNTLMILIADHGHRLPGNSPVYSLNKFKIPMLWLGGALTKKDTVIAKFGSQHDIPATLLRQMGIHTDYPFSKNLLGTSSKSFAYYSYNNGFGFLSDSLRLVFDNVYKKYLVKEGVGSETDLKLGKAFQQVLMEDFIHR